MKTFLRILRIFLLTLAGIMVAFGALFAYFVYSPSPARPALSGTVAHATMQIDGLERAYTTYIPGKLAKGAALVLVMHGSGESAAQIRVETGYAFERLADEQGFAVVYPESYSFDWNDCSKMGDFLVKERPVDDVAFLSALADKLVAELGGDAKRVFATGVSAGGFMSLRLALEAPSRFRAVAAVAANVPRSDNFKCKPAGTGTSVMIMNGTSDPLVPFDGGEVNLLGLFYRGGSVLSTRESVKYFVDLNKIAGEAVIAPAVGQDSSKAEQLLWRDGGKTEVELVAIHGGGHGLPQPWYRRPRLLGPSPMAPNGAAIIWEFFSRQRTD